MSEPADLRPLALAGAGVGAMWAATSADPRVWAVAAAFAAGCSGWAWWRRSAFWLAMAVVIVGLGSGGAWRSGALATGPVVDLADDRAAVVAQVRLAGSSRLRAASGVRPALWTGGGRLLAVEGRGSAWSTGVPVDVVVSGEDAAAWGALAPGTVVETRARLELADPGEAAVVVVRAREPPIVRAPPSGPDAAVAAVRAGLRAASGTLGPDARALVPALVLGDTSGVDDDLAEQFRRTGLTHLTAVSGANLTLLLVFLRVVAVRIGVRGRWLTGVLLAGVAAFVAVCLGEPSVVRAAAMGVVGMAALGRGSRPGRGVRYLATAVLGVVLVDPWLSRSVGFWLSAVATFGLLWWGRPWTDALARWLPRPVGEAVAVALAAQVATEPVVVWLSGRVSMVGVLANVVAAPLVGPATVLGVAAAVLSVVWLPAAVACAWLAGWCAQAIAQVARLGAALPGAAVEWPASPVTIALVAAACTVAVVLLPRVLVRPWLCVPLAVALVVSLGVVPPRPGWPPGAWAVVVCDAGQGDATLLNAGGGAAVLIDAGPEPAALAQCLTRLGVHAVPLVVLTHLHADHVGGLPGLAGLEVRSVLTSAVRTPASGDALVTGVGVLRATAASGQVWTVGDVRLAVLFAPAGPVGPDAAGEGESSGENDASLLVRADVAGVSVLLAGDAEEGGQAARLREAGAALDVDVLLVPHHGSSRQSPEFLTATTPQVALVSVGAGNDYGHPTQKTLTTVARLGAAVARTDEQGSLAVARVAGELRLTTGG